MEAIHVSWIIADFPIRLMLLCMSPEGLNIATVFFTYEAVYFSMVLGLVIVELYFCFSLETTLVTLEQHILKLASVLLPMNPEVRHPDGYLAACYTFYWVVMLFMFVLAHKNPVFALEAALIALALL